MSLSQESGTPRRSWSLLFLRRRREQRRFFPRWRAGRRILCFVFFLFHPPPFSKKEQFPFPPDSYFHGTTVYDVLLPHSRSRTILPAAKRAWFRDAVLPHAPLARPVWDPGSSARTPQNVPPSIPSSPTPLRCTTTGTSIVPLEPLAPDTVSPDTGSHGPVHLAGSGAQFDLAARFSSPGYLSSSMVFSRLRWHFCGESNSGLAISSSNVLSAPCRHQG